MSATNRGAERVASDFYATPLSAFTPLLPHLDITAEHWEPSCGDRRLIHAMNAYGIRADGADIRDARPVDFLTDPTVRQTIITNPPFSMAMEFATHALTHSDEAYLLLRLNFLASQKRAAWFAKNEPSALFVLARRPCFTEDGKTDATDYAWFYWGTRHLGIVHLLESSR